MSEFSFYNFAKEKVSGKKFENSGFLTHITDCYSLRNIIEDGELTASQCSKFKEKLNYFFYGKPTYRLATDGTATKNGAWFPSCIIFKEDIVPSPRRIFPFDSGGFEFYQEYFRNKMKLEDFSIPNTYSAANNIIECFYSSFENYYIESPIHIEYDSFQFYFEAQAYYDLINSKASTIIDERCSSLEIQTEKNIKVDFIYAIIMPSNYRTTVEYLLEKKRISCKLDHYHTGGKTSPKEYFSELRNLAKKIII
jgi:hypothetical protein